MSTWREARGWRTTPCWCTEEGVLVVQGPGPACPLGPSPLGRFVSRFISPIRSPVQVGLEVLAQGACGRTPLL